MQVAVADMAEPDDLEIRVMLADDGINLPQEGRNLADGDRDVVLVRRPVGNGLGDELAQLPQVLQLLLALAHHPVQHPALLHAVLEGRQRLVCHLLADRLELQQGIEGTIGVKRRRYITTGQYLGHGLVGEELESGQIQLALEGVQYRHDRVEVRRAQHHGGEVLGCPLQAHGGLHDEAQGAFGADEQLAQIVTGGVLHQALVQFQQLAGTGDHFQPGYPVAGHAVADHLDATGVGADIAADLAGAGGGEIHWVVQPLFLGELLQLGSDHARLAGHGAVVGIEIENAVHVVEGHHDLAIGGHRAGGQPGAAAGGGQRQFVFVGKAHHSLHILDAAGEDDGQRRRLELPGPVAAPIGQRLAVGTHLVGVKQRFQFLDDGFWGHGRSQTGFKLGLNRFHAARAVKKGRLC